MRQQQEESGCLTACRASLSEFLAVRVAVTLFLIVVSVAGERTVRGIRKLQHALASAGCVSVLNSMRTFPQRVRRSRCDGDNGAESLELTTIETVAKRDTRLLFLLRAAQVESAQAWASCTFG